MKQQIRLLRWMSFAIAAALLVGGAAAASEPLTARWTVEGVDAERVSLEALTGRLVTLTVTGADTVPQAELVCSNAATGEIGTAHLWPVAARHSVDGHTLLLNLGPVWGALPYPVDPGALESKPLAIISQQASSPFRMDVARLRRMFADVAAYMSTTAGHHYPLPLGDGQLDCRFEVITDSARTASNPLFVTFGRGLPYGVYPRDFARPVPASWPLWVLSPDTLPALPAVPDEAQTRRELDELLRLQAARTREQVNLIREWDDGSAVGPWIGVTLDAIIAHSSANPPRAARALGLVSVAVYEATVTGAHLSWQVQRPAPCQLEPRLLSIGGDCAAIYTFPSEHALAAGAASTVLAHLYPTEAERFESLAQQAALTRLWAGANYRSDVEAGLELGRRVGLAVVDRALHDGADATWDGKIPDFSTWKPTPPQYEPPLEPLAGSWRPWNLESGSALRPAPPPAPDSDTFLTEMREVYAVERALTLEQQQIASYWEDKQGTYAPPGHWNVVALRQVRAHGLSTVDAALLFAALNTAQADAFIACWDAKYAYWSVRPITAIRAVIDPNWWAYIITPPFPSYPSGHATVSGAASTVLAHFFPGQADQFTAWAEQAALSRLYGGIHFRIDNEAGLALGRAVGQAALAHLLTRALPASIESSSARS